MSDFESELAKIPLRRTPVEWRAEILRVARSAAVEAAISPEATTGTECSALPWWRRWLGPQPLTLTAAWLVIAILRLATPEDSAAPKTADVAQIKAQVRAQQELLAELLHPATAPAPAPPRRQGAIVRRRELQLADCDWRKTFPGAADLSLASDLARPRGGGNPFRQAA